MSLSTLEIKIDLTIEKLLVLKGEIVLVWESREIPTYTSNYYRSCLVLLVGQLYLKGS